ncbi:DNRLRE domain-containing protein [Sorangium sp. So ce1128]
MTSSSPRFRAVRASGAQPGGTSRARQGLLRPYTSVHDGIAGRHVVRCEGAQRRRADHTVGALHTRLTRDSHATHAPLLCWKPAYGAPSAVTFTISHANSGDDGGFALFVGGTHIDTGCRARPTPTRATSTTTASATSAILVAYRPSSATSSLYEVVEGTAAGAPYSTSAMDLTALVQAWVDGAHLNHGVLLEENAGARTAFRSSEHHAASQRPRIEVCYTPY